MMIQSEMVLRGRGKSASAKSSSVDSANRTAQNETDNEVAPYILPVVCAEVSDAPASSA